MVKRSRPQLRRKLFTLLKRLDSIHKVAGSLPGATWMLRFMSFLLYRLLELSLGSGHPHTRVTRQARRLSDGLAASLAPHEGVDVLFFTLRGWFAHATTEAVLATALQQRRVTTQFFLCGGVLDQCDFAPASDPHPTRPLCWRCMGFPRRLFEGLELDYLMIGDLVDLADLKRRSRERVEYLTRGELLDFEYRGLPVGRYVLPSVHRTLLSGTVGTDSRSVSTLRSFVASACVMTDVASRLLERSRPSCVVMTNGLFFSERIMLELALSHGVRVVTYERGIPADTVIVGVNASVVPFDVDPYWDRRRNHALTDDERAALLNELAGRTRGDTGVQDIWPRMEADGHAIARRLGLRSDRPLTVLFTNILWDTAVFGMDVGFDGMMDWVATTIRIFKGSPDHQLVIRIHPAEVRLPMEESQDRVGDAIAEMYPSLPDNVAVIAAHDSASSYSLLEAADRVLTYTSTIGVEAAVRGKRVVVAGNVHYGRRGFTIDIDDRATYERTLASADTLEPLAAHERELADRYAYAFLFEFMRPFPWFMDRGRHARALNIDTRSDLAPGRDSMLDDLCELILGHRELPLPAGRLGP